MSALRQGSFPLSRKFEGPLVQSQLHNSLSQRSLTRSCSSSVSAPTSLSSKNSLQPPNLSTLIAPPPLLLDSCGPLKYAEKLSSSHPLRRSNSTSMLAPAGPAGRVPRSSIPPSVRGSIVAPTRGRTGSLVAPAGGGIASCILPRQASNPPNLSRVSSAPGSLLATPGAHVSSRGNVYGNSSSILGQPRPVTQDPACRDVASDIRRTARGPKKPGFSTQACEERNDAYNKLVFDGNAEFGHGSQVVNQVRVSENAGCTTSKTFGSEVETALDADMPESAASEIASLLGARDRHILYLEQKCADAQRENLAQSKCLMSMQEELLDLKQMQFSADELLEIAQQEIKTTRHEMAAIRRNILAKQADDQRLEHCSVDESVESLRQKLAAHEGVCEQCLYDPEKPDDESSELRLCKFDEKLIYACHRERKPRRLMCDEVESFDRQTHKLQVAPRKFLDASDRKTVNRVPISVTPSTMMKWVHNG